MLRIFYTELSRAHAQALGALSTAGSVTVAASVPDRYGVYDGRDGFHSGRYTSDNMRVLYMYFLIFSGAKEPFRHPGPGFAVVIFPGF